ncbi:MAG: MBL fold metallo-hydrolase [Anaerolineae bacterium]|nr:MBL fold metallo-hydrolase [Anaerolineae bacterium]
MSPAHAIIDQMQNTPIIPNSLAIWGLGQMGIAIKGPDAVLYIDPCLSDIVRDVAGDWWTRAYPPPLLPQDITNATYYLASHEHIDHLDVKTAAPAAKASPDALFITTGWCADMLDEAGIAPSRRLVPPALQPITLPGSSIRLTVVPSAHYDLEHDDQKGYRWFGYIIEWNGVTFYHAGDTIIYPTYVETLKRLPVADLAMLPVNGRDWYRETVVGATGNLLPEEAAQLANEIGWKTIIPGHNDMFPNNTIPMSSIVDALARFAPRQQYKILQPGELYYFVK